ncbi:MAG: hypothetical protein KJ703_09150 [Alphaproteobacteria bacterium]|nr:hypothetical protein [Alphaproteobacteria bacterium]
MTWIAILAFLAAVPLGAAASHLLFRMLPSPRLRRAAILIAFPLLIYLGWFFSHGWPDRADWAYLLLGLVLFSPFFMAWFIGCILARIVRQSPTAVDD